MYFIAYNYKIKALLIDNFVDPDIYNDKELEIIWKIRRSMNNAPNQEVTEMIIRNLMKTDTNKDFVEMMANKIRF